MDEKDLMNRIIGELLHCGRSSISWEERRCISVNTMTYDLRDKVRAFLPKIARSEMYVALRFEQSEEVYVVFTLQNPDEG